MRTTKQKSIVDTQKRERNLIGPPQKIIKSQTKRAREEKRNKGIIKKPENNEQNGNSKSTVDFFLFFLVRTACCPVSEFFF